MYRDKRVLNKERSLQGKGVVCEIYLLRILSLLPQIFWYPLWTLCSIAPEASSVKRVQDFNINSI